MALSNVSVWQRSRFTLQWFIINLVGSLACLTAVALAQFERSESVSGSVSIPDVAFTCLGNLAVFMTAFARGRLDVENGARDVLATTRGPKLRAINGSGLTTCRSNDLKAVDVVLLSKYNERPYSSLTQFMRYISHSHALETILLQVFPLASSVVKFTPETSVPGTCKGDLAEGCRCVSVQFTPETSVQFTPDTCKGHLAAGCRCVVLRAAKDIMIMIAQRLPRTIKLLKLLPNNDNAEDKNDHDHFLLLSLSCLNNHCSPDLEYVEAAGESSTLGTSHSPAAAVCEALDQFLIEEENSCICIPLHPANDDRWTKFLIKFLKSKERKEKGIEVQVSDALQCYITRSAEELGSLFGPGSGIIEIYSSASLILPRVAEVIVNIILTVWGRVDGFSSSLFARWASRDYVVDSTGTGFSANAFLTQALVFGSADWTNVCQVLEFRRGILSARRVSYILGCVNVICSIAWSVLITCEGNWAPSTPLSTRRLAIIIVAVGVALGMDCFDFYVAEARLQAQAWASRRARALAQAQGKDRAWAFAGVHAEAQVRAGAFARAGGLSRADAEAQLRAEAQARAEAEAQARAEAEAQVREARAEAYARHMGYLGADVEAGDFDRPHAQAQVWTWDSVKDWAWVRALTWAWALAPAQVLALMAVVILEVQCIVGLIIMLSMKKGVGRWVYSGMQVLVWLKWGIGSFILGDNAGQKENRGTWVYFSAFLLWVGTLPQWEYFKLVK